jgi:predicted GTPase
MRKKEKKVGEDESLVVRITASAMHKTLDDVMPSRQPAVDNYQRIALTYAISML